MEVGATELIFVVLAPDETVDDADSVECDEVAGMVETFAVVLAGACAGTSGDVGAVVMVVLYLDVTTFEQGKQLEMACI